MSAVRQQTLFGELLRRARQTGLRDALTGKAMRAQRR